jgi:hypothetical protein
MGVGKLDTAAVFDHLFSLYRKQFPVLIGVGAAIFVPIAVLSGLAASSGSVALIPIVVILAAIGQSYYTGAVVEAVADMRDGRRDFSVGDLLRAAAPFMFPLLAAGFVYGLCVAVGLIALIIPGLLFLTWFSLFAPAIVLERRGILESFTRSRELVRGNGWGVFGVIVVAFVIQAVVNNLVQRIGLDIADSWLLAVLFTAIGSILTAPILGLAVSVVYFDLRDLKEPVPPTPVS